MDATGSDTSHASRERSTHDGDAFHFYVGEVAPSCCGRCPWFGWIWAPSQILKIGGFYDSGVRLLGWQLGVAVSRHGVTGPRRSQNIMCGVGCHDGGSVGLVFVFSIGGVGVTSDAAPSVWCCGDSGVNQHG